MLVLDLGLLILTLVCIFYCKLLNKQLYKVQATREQLIVAQENLKNQLDQTTAIISELQLLNNQALATVVQLRTSNQVAQDNIKSVSIASTMFSNSQSPKAPLEDFQELLESYNDNPLENIEATPLVESNEINSKKYSYYDTLRKIRV